MSARAAPARSAGQPVVAVRIFDLFENAEVRYNASRRRSGIPPNDHGVRPTRRGWVLQRRRDGRLEFLCTDGRWRPRRKSEFPLRPLPPEPQLETHH